MSDTYTYKFGENLYINLTNRCSNSCIFCLRNNGDGIGGNKLWLKKEPTASEVIESIKKVDSFNEAVFCGYGESTYRLSELIEIAAFLKEQGHRTRLDTNGHGSVINGFDISEKLVGLIDTVSVSLNQSDSEKYDLVARPCIPNAYEEMLDFATKCAKRGLKVTMSVVDVIGKADIEKCRQIASECGVDFRVREYIEDN